MCWGLMTPARWPTAMDFLKVRILIVDAIVVAGIFHGRIFSPSEHHSISSGIAQERNTDASLTSAFAALLSCRRWMVCEDASFGRTSLFFGFLTSTMNWPDLSLFFEDLELNIITSPLFASLVRYLRCLTCVSRPLPTLPYRCQAILVSSRGRRASGWWGTMRGVKSETGRFGGMEARYR